MKSIIKRKKVKDFIPGQWYKYIGSTYGRKLVNYQVSDKGYGVWEGRFRDDVFIAFPDLWEPADDKEVIYMLSVELFRINHPEKWENVFFENSKKN